MRELVFEGVSRLAWREAAAPVLHDPSEALVRPLAVARCDLDVAIVRGTAPFRGKPLHWLREHLPHRLGRDGLFRRAPFAAPFSFGHECVAEVLEVGEAVRGFARGDLVVLPFQLSCGACDRCRRGLTASCEAVPHGASYGLGRGVRGVLSDVVSVPFADAMLLRAPDVDVLELASAGDNVADGVRTVLSPLRARPGASVLVVGGLAASVGLYAVLAAIALGAESVAYHDQDVSRLRLAEALGATAIAGPYRPQRPRAITVDASADPRGLAAAVRSTEPGGTCTSVGIYFASETPFPLLPAFMNGLTFHTGRVCSRAMLPDVLALIGGGALVPSRVTTHVAPWDEAPRAFLEHGAKVIVHRPRIT